ncbi:MAG: HAD family phosphatase [Candidatus Nanopelagicales bacterium]
MIPFQALLYDMDGTLVDTEPKWQESERTLMAGFGVPWTDADQAHCLGGSTDRVARYMADLVAAAGRPRPDPEDLADQFLVTMRDQLIADPPQPQPGVARLLRQVRDSGLPTALVSSSSRPLMDAVLAAIGSEWFDITISADDVERHKPDPLPYLRAAEILGVDPAWCLAIEDSPTGAEAARQAGAFVVAVEHLAVIPATTRRRVVTTLSGVGLPQLTEWFEPPS